ncbi:acyl-CoA dehydrogenase family protein [Pseudorhodoferax sp. LjRoot39]|uniref:acyl-CoA dehydrogenase family protein n=1 Tax=Pseudorhodoferax sp. LjRoot39 TaxID=3342328 RepID=UPI003ECFE0F5
MTTQATTDFPAVTDPVAVARSLVPLLAANAAAAEKDRRASDESIRALREAGLLRMMFPRRAGGAGHKLITHVETVAELAKGCAGTAWAFGLLSGVTASVASMPAVVAGQVFQTGNELVCSVAGQTGTARETGDGYLIDGAWGYASGCLHADWALNGVRILDRDGQVVDAGFALLQIDGAQVTVRDTWQVAGLAASGSNTVVAEKVAVPRTRVLRFSQMRQGAGQPVSAAASALEPRDRWPVEPLFPLGVLSPMLGAATALLDAVVASARQRPIIGWKYANQADSQVFVNQIGESALDIDAAWLHVRRAVSAVDETAQQRPLTGFEKARVQADCGHAMRHLRRAGERLMDVAGPGAFAAASPLQRYWRDLSVGTRHTALNSALSSELYGRALLGLDSNLQLLARIDAGA